MAWLRPEKAEAALQTLKRKLPPSAFSELVAAAPLPTWLARNAESFADAIESTEQLVLPTNSLYEVSNSILQQRRERDALQAVALMQQGRVVELSPALALESARMSIVLRRLMADSIMLATARAFDAVLWTQDANFEDANFEGVDGVRYAPA